MKFFLLLFLFCDGGARAAETKPALQKTKDGSLKQTYEGNIRGIRALMSDLKKNQPDIHQKLNHDFRDLDDRQKKADRIAYGTYGVAAAFAAYGFAQWFGLVNSSPENRVSFTPFLISLGVSFGGGWLYYAARPSPQEYLDFTNKHNRLNSRQQLEWDTTFKHRGASVGLAYRF